MWSVSPFFVAFVLAFKKLQGKKAQPFQKSLVNIVGFHKFLVSQLMGHFACNPGYLSVLEHNSC